MAREAGYSHVQSEPERRRVVRQPMRPDQIPAGFEGYGNNENREDTGVDPVAAVGKVARTPEEAREMGENVAKLQLALEGTIRKTLRPAFEGKKSADFDAAVEETRKRALAVAGDLFQQYSVKEAVDHGKYMAEEHLRLRERSQAKLDKLFKKKSDAA